MYKKIPIEIAFGIISILVLVAGVLIWVNDQGMENGKQQTVDNKQQSLDGQQKVAVEDSGKAQIANPSSQFCAENGGKSEIRTAQDGSQTGYCMFENENECEEWAYMRGECKKQVGF